MRKKIKWKTELEKDVLIDNFEKRGWQETLDGKPIFEFNFKMVGAEEYLWNERFFNWINNFLSFIE